MIKYLVGLFLALGLTTAQAQDRMFAVAPNGAVITLTQEVGPCVNGAKVANYLAPNKKDTLNGCWKVSDSAPVISIAWFDGDGSAIPAQVFKPVKTL